MIFPLLRHTHHGPHWGDGPHWGGWEAAGGSLWWPSFFWLLLSLLLVALIVVGVVALLTNTSATRDSDRAMSVLRERYARGEISDEEFEKRVARLSPESSDNG